MTDPATAPREGARFLGRLRCAREWAYVASRMHLLLIDGSTSARDAQLDVVVNVDHLIIYRSVSGDGGCLDGGAPAEDEAVEDDEAAVGFESQSVAAS